MLPCLSACRETPLGVQPLKLHIVVFGVDAVFLDQILMGAPLLDAFVADHDDFIRVSDGAQAVGNDDGGPVFRERFQ